MLAGMHCCLCDSFLISTFYCKWYVECTGTEIIWKYLPKNARQANLVHLPGSQIISKKYDVMSHLKLFEVFLNYRCSVRTTQIFSNDVNRTSSYVIVQFENIWVLRPLNVLLLRALLSSAVSTQQRKHKNLYWQFIPHHVEQ